MEREAVLVHCLVDSTFKRNCGAGEGEPGPQTDTLRTSAWLKCSCSASLFYSDTHMNRDSAAVMIERFYG